MQVGFFVAFLLVLVAAVGHVDSRRWQDRLVFAKDDRTEHEGGGSAQMHLGNRYGARSLLSVLESRDLAADGAQGGLDAALGLEAEAGHRRSPTWRRAVHAWQRAGDGRRVLAQGSRASHVDDPFDDESFGNGEKDEDSPVTSSFRGRWSHTGAGAASAYLTHDAGVAVLRLRAYKPESDAQEPLPRPRVNDKDRRDRGAAPEVRQVLGEMVLRDGESVGSEAVKFNVRGVYVPETGRLVAAMEPHALTPMHARVASNTTDRASYREALRSAAQRLGDSRPFGAPPSAADLFDDEGRLQHRCTLTLDAGVFSWDGTHTDAASLPAGVPVDLAPIPRPHEAQWGFLDAAIAGAVRSDPSCGLTAHFLARAVDLDAYYSKASVYASFMGCITIALSWLFVRLPAAQGGPGLPRVSQGCVMMHAVLDAYLCLLHLTVAIVVERLCFTLGTLAVLQFILFAVIEMRLLLAAWRATDGASMDMNQARRAVSVIYTRFYLLLLGLLLLSFNVAPATAWLALVPASFWVPQIHKSARAGQRPPFDPRFIWGTTALRLLPLAYVLVCPNNVLRTAPSPGLFLLLGGWVVAQAAVLHLQLLWGPMWLVPVAWRPQKYDYYRKVVLREEDQGDVETGEAGPLCAICMAVVEVDPPAGRMVTPCNHFYHPTCLLRWMDIKHECPTCRQTLPPV
ncbi:unnamed protein product [Pedinophyceae sp. YPF-701]|nr:unnamed protein product [Pedinophyceae sp. YPF-701]